MSEVSKPQNSPIGPLKAWLDEPLEDRVMALVEDPSLLELVRDLIEQLEALQLAGWTAERVLMRIADGARSNPGGQVSEFAHEAAGNLRRSLESNPATSSERGVASGDEAVVASGSSSSPRSEVSAPAKSPHS